MNLIIIIIISDAVCACIFAVLLVHKVKFLWTNWASELRTATHFQIGGMNEWDISERASERES